MKSLLKLKEVIEIFNQLSVGFVITNPNLKDNPIIFVNDYVEKLTGYKKDYFLGKNCRFLQNDDTNQEGIKNLKESLEKQIPCLVTLRNYKKNNELFINELSISPIFENEKIKYYVGVQKDVTLEYLLKEEMYTNNLIQKRQLEDLNTSITKILNTKLDLG